MASYLSFRLKKDSGFRIPKVTRTEPQQQLYRGYSLSSDDSDNHEDLQDERFDKTRSFKSKEAGEGTEITNDCNQEIKIQLDERRTLSSPEEAKLKFGGGEMGLDLESVERDVLLIKTIPLSVGNNLHISDVNDHFNKFGSVLHVNYYGLPTGRNDFIVNLPGHYQVEFAYALGLESALCGGKIQKINSVLGHSVNVKLFRMSSHLERIIAKKTASFRTNKLNSKNFSASVNATDSNNNLSSFE